MMTKELTSNQHYGGLNRRFESRAKRLRQMGYKYEVVCKGVAAFRKRQGYFSESNVTAAEVLYADQRSWRDKLATLPR